MARHIDANFQYADWYNEWDWCRINGKSVIRWGSASDSSSSTDYNPTDGYLVYDPNNQVPILLNTYQMRRFRALMGYRAIVLGAYWWWRQGAPAGSGSFDLRLHRLYKPYPDIDDCSYQYKDITATTGWYLNGYAPQLGHDTVTAYTARMTWDDSINQNVLVGCHDITDYFVEQLLANDDLWFETFQVTSGTPIQLGTSVTTARPKLDVYYLHPVEMYPEKAAIEEIDLTRLLATDVEPIDLGAYQQSETGAAIRFYIKNWSRQTINHIEVWDDFPEWSDPAADAGNGGSGDLDYVTVFEECVSQRWEIKFSSSTAYEVKATSYLDNLESLHPSYDADASWLGATSGDWSDPDGNITIPSAAWSGTPNAGDLFYVYSRGNTTDNTWPADSNDQVEMCGDSGGSPDGNWRTITAQRTVATAGVTIDSATKTITVKRIDTTDWPNGTEVFIADQDNIDEGTIQSTTATTVVITGLSITNNVYAAGAIVATTLPLRSIAATPWAQTTATSGSSETYPDRIYIDSVGDYSFVNGETIFIQSLEDPDTNEEAVIQTQATGYLDLATDLVNDYEVGSMVAQLGAGEKTYYLRVAADPATTEELKEFRLAVIA